MCLLCHGNNGKINLNSFHFISKIEFLNFFLCLSLRGSMTHFEILLDSCTVFTHLA